MSQEKKPTTITKPRSWLFFTADFGYLEPLLSDKILKIIPFHQVPPGSLFYINGTPYQKRSEWHGRVVGRPDLCVECHWDRMVEVEDLNGPPEL